MAGDSLAGVLGEVMPQVPPVRDLDRARGARAGAFRICAGPVTADHTGARVGGQPVRQRACLPAGQHVDRPPGGGVDQDGPVDMPAAQREMIDADHLGRGGDGRVRQGHDQAQQGAAVNGDAQRRSQPGPGPPGQLEGDLGQ